MKNQPNLDAVFAADLKDLFVVSYIVLCNNAVSNRFIEKQFGMPVQAWSSLYLAEAFPGIMAKEIKQIFPRPQNTISRAIALLEKRALVRQEASLKDGRQKRIYITRSGRSLLRQIRAVSIERQAELFSPLTAKERQVFVTLARKVAYGAALKESRVMSLD